MRHRCNTKWHELLRDFQIWRARCFIHPAAPIGIQPIRPALPHKSHSGVSGKGRISWKSNRRYGDEYMHMHSCDMPLIGEGRNANLEGRWAVTAGNIPFLNSQDLQGRISTNSTAWIRELEHGQGLALLAISPRQERLWALQQHQTGCYTFLAGYNHRPMEVRFSTSKFQTLWSDDVWRTSFEFAGKFTNDMYRYDPIAGLWSIQSTSGIGPSARGGGGFAATLSGLIFAFSGRGNVDTGSRNKSFDHK